MNDEKRFEILSSLFTQSIRKKIFLGLIPSKDVERFLLPILHNYNEFESKLDKKSKKKINRIFDIYPEIAIKHDIKRKLSVFNYFKMLWLWICVATRVTIDHIKEIHLSPVKVKFAYATIPIITILLAVIYITQEKTSFFSPKMIAEEKKNNLLSEIITQEEASSISTKMIANLSKSIDISKVFKPDSEILKSKHYSFDSCSNPYKTAFNFGRFYAGTELSLESNNVDQLNYYISSFKLMVEKYDHANEIKVLLDNIKNLYLKKSNIRPDINELLNKLKNIINYDEIPYFYLGEWCEISHTLLLLDQEISKDDFFSSKYEIFHVFNSLKDKKLKQGAKDAIQKIKEISAKDHLSEKNIYYFKKHIEQLIKNINKDC